MTFGVKLSGALHYDDGEAATAAFAAMMAGREENWMLTEGAKLDGATIRFDFDNFLPVSRGSDWVDSTEFGIEKALVTAASGAVVYSDETGFTRTMPALGRAFWYDKWAQGKTAFHEGAANELLAAHVGELERTAGKLRILVPLAGKAADMWWLADRGHEVVGVEFVISAVDAFFAERDIDLWQHKQPLGPFDAFVAQGVTMLCEDFFKLTPDAIGTFDAIYDRAALVALEPSMRARYVEICRALCKPSARVLLVSLAYDQSATGGPPWSIDRAEVEALWPGAKLLEAHAVPAPPRFQEAGVATFAESAYVVGSGPGPAERIQRE